MIRGHPTCTDTICGAPSARTQALAYVEGDSMEGSLDERNPIMVFGCTACAIGSFVTTLPPAGTMTRRHMSFAFALLWDVIAYGGSKTDRRNWTAVWE